MMQASKPLLPVERPTTPPKQGKKRKKKKRIANGRNSSRASPSDII
jgi:hypothetical protein